MSQTFIHGLNVIISFVLLAYNLLINEEPFLTNLGGLT